MSESSKHGERPNGETFFGSISKNYFAHSTASRFDRHRLILPHN